MFLFRSRDDRRTSPAAGTRGITRALPVEDRRNRIRAIQSAGPFRTLESSNFILGILRSKIEIDRASTKAQA